MHVEQNESRLHITKYENAIIGLISPSGDQVASPKDTRFFASDVSEVVWKLGIHMKDHVETTLTMQRYIWNPVTWLMPKRVLTSQPIQVSTTVS